ncbi:hypothetical protein ACJMK2_036170, partial [Sinanodonta woodiana]
MVIMAKLQPLTMLYYVARFLYVVVNNLMYIPCYLTYIVLLYPLKCLKPEIYWTIETVLFKHLLNFVTVWIYSGGYKVVESGDDLRSLHNSHCLLLVNHQSTADVPMVMVLLQPKSMAMGRVMWVMDHLFKYTNFGLPAYYHGDYFIQQGKQFRTAQMEKLQKHLQEVYLKTYKKWIVLFPEGGFLRKRRKASQEYAKKHDLPILENVVLPRVGAMNVVLDTVGNAELPNGIVS